jgi:2-polyprenyl-3-methyl-5-hydroxy-6-metoxy-1,4-benzoquinol methylase
LPATETVRRSVRKALRHPAALWTRWQLIKLHNRIGRPVRNSETLYDEYLGGEDAPFVLKGRYALADALVPEGASVLEVGCGSGGYVRHLHERGRRVLGLDFCRSAIERLGAEGVPAGVHDLGTNAPLPTGYDVVLCLEVLEHFAEPWAIYERLWAAAGRRVIFSVPDRYKVPDPNHLAEFSYASIVAALSPRGPVIFQGGHPSCLIVAQDKPPRP